MTRAEYMKEYMAKRRSVNKDVNNSDDVNKVLTDDRGFKYKTLSDGQRWYFEISGGYHPSGCTCGITHATR